MVDKILVYEWMFAKPGSVPQPKTRVFVSKSAMKQIAAHVARKKDPDGTYLKTLTRAGMNGFWLLERTVPPVVKPEWDGVWRFGPKGYLFRLIGFYSDPCQDRFIIIDAFLKLGTRLNAAERKRIDAVAKVLRDVNWEYGDGEK